MQYFIRLSVCTVHYHSHTQSKAAWSAALLLWINKEQEEEDSGAGWIDRTLDFSYDRELRVTCFEGKNEYINLCPYVSDILAWQVEQSFAKASHFKETWDPAPFPTLDNNTAAFFWPLADH